MSKYLLRAVAAIVGVLTLTLGTLSVIAGPASAHGVCNWDCPNNVDNLETDIYVDAYFSTVWHIGSSSMRPCNLLTFQNRRPDTHSVRIEWVSGGGSILWTGIKTVDPGETVFWDLDANPVQLASYVNEPYFRYTWGDGAYGTREVDHFWNWAGDTNDVHSFGYYCS